MEAVIQKTTEKVCTGTATVFHSKAKGESQRKEELFMLNKIEKKQMDAVRRRKKYCMRVRRLAYKATEDTVSPTEVFCSRQQRSGKK